MTDSANPYEPAAIAVDASLHYREQRKAESSGSMATWIRGCTILALPINVLVFIAARISLGYDGSYSFLGFWLIAYPVFCGLIAIGTACYFTSWLHVPRLLAFSLFAAFIAAVNYPVFLLLYMFHDLGRM